MKNFTYQLKELFKNLIKLFSMKLILLYFIGHFISIVIVPQIGNYEDQYRFKILNYNPSFNSTL